MMTVERKINPYTTMFEDLPLGEVYRDEDGCLAIKVSNKEEGNCLTLGWPNGGNEWSLTTESLDTEVTPLKATLTVWEEE